MDLNILLKKTEARSAKITTTRQPPSIATEERPYNNDLNEINSKGPRGVVDKKESETKTEARPDLGQSSDKVRPQPRTSIPSSSSILINEDLKLTTTSSDENSQLYSEWRVINFSSLLEQGVPFSETHLLQLAQRTKHTPKMVQHAIEHFAFDLKHNSKKSSIKGDLIGFFMGIMQRGMYLAPSNFVDPGEAELDQYLTQQEAKLVRIQEKLAKKETLDFELWLLETTEVQRREIAPQANQDLSDMQKGILRNHWKSSISKTCIA